MRMVEARVAAQELEAVAGPRSLESPKVCEGDPVRELSVPGVSSKEGSGRRVDLGDHVRNGARAPDTEHPLRVGCDRETAGAAGAILQSEARDFDRIAQRHEHQEIQSDA